MDVDGHHNAPLTRDTLLNETVFQWYLDLGQGNCAARVIEIFPEFKGPGEMKMKNKIGSFAHTIKNASASVRRDILSKPFKPPGTRGVRSSRPKSDDEDDDSPTEETQPLGRRKASNRARVNYNVRDLTLPRVTYAYDSEGKLLNHNGFDLCDCLEAQCPGCHFPCLRCGSEKCGDECRVRRKWTFDHIEIEGTDFKIRFPNLP